MATIRSVLRKRRVLNYERHHFIPEGCLDVIEPQVVQDVLAACNISSWKIPGLQATITAGAKKTFAVLILIRQEAHIVHFIEHDDFQNQPVDSKLPFSLDTLKHLIPQHAEEFFEEQWQFTAPVFTRQLIHRYFSDDTVLPFLAVRPLGKGGFGQVHEITLPWNHQDYISRSGSTVANVRLAKKELEVNEEHGQEPAVSWQATGANEHEILSMLHHLKHPNILALFASYTHRGKHNLIFPIADSGDLHSFLISVHRPVELCADEKIYAALSGLSSALATLHDYRSTTFEMEMIGYHHDLKPKNILVAGDQFILADFGLSKLEARDSSKTEFKIGRGHYLAPECEDLLDHFKKGIISRASDVWSFGCILLEVAIFMHYGYEGVHKFRDDRKYEVSNFITRTFFVRAGLNPAVTAWATKLSQKSPLAARVSRLILEILQIVPQERPRANHITIHLRSIAVQSLYNVAYTGLKHLYGIRSTYDVYLELQRLKAWGDIFNFDGSNVENSEEDETFHNNLTYKTVVEHLKLMSEFTSRQNDSVDLTTPVHFALRSINDALFGQLTRRQQERAHRQLESHLLSTADNLGLDPIALFFVDRGLLTASRQMHALMEEKTMPLERDRKVSRESLRDWKSFHAADQATYNPGSGQQQDLSVMVEWVVYDVHWNDGVGKQLFNRIDALVDLLSSPSNAARLHILLCRGYFHAPDRHAFGLVYELPIPTIRSIEDAYTTFSLCELIQSTQDVRQRPLLGDLFVLAHSLATSLFSIHKITWLHKALTSSNVIFSVPDSRRREFNLAQYYRIIGFNHSRPDKATEYTEAAWKRSVNSRLYQHPHYLENTSRFCIEYDYYSFGLVLLELGLWKPLVDLVPQKVTDERSAHSVSPREISAYLLERKVPVLGQKVGRKYRDAVAFCLSMNPQNAEPSFQAVNNDMYKLRIDLQVQFERNVIHALSSCEA